METAIRYHKTFYGTGEKRITIPIFFLLVYMVCTFFPQIYIYFPFLGTMRAVLIAGWGILISYLNTRRMYHNPMDFQCQHFLPILIIIKSSTESSRFVRLNEPEE